MAPPDHEGEGSGAAKGRRGVRRRRPREEDAGEETKRKTVASPPPPAVDVEVDDWVGKQVREAVAKYAEEKRLAYESDRSMSGKDVLTVESRFGNIHDGSIGSLKARKAAVMISQSIVSLSSFSEILRPLIVTSATLVRSLNGDNVMVSDLMVKVLVPNGTISDGSISLVDFHYNIAVIEVPSDLKIPVVSLANHIAVEGDVAGVGGPLADYNGHVVGINFYEKDRTPFLSIAIVSRILEHHQRKTILPWLGLKYIALETVSLRVLERIYQKFPDVDKGLYISNVAVGSSADMAGLCAGDVLVKCGGKDLSTTPQFGSMLLDTCKQHADTHDWETSGDYAWENIEVEVVVKQDRDGTTMSKTISAALLKEFHYNRHDLFLFLLHMACSNAKLQGSLHRCHAKVAKRTLTGDVIDIGNIESSFKGCSP
ncbi:hypothetical protein EJB05_32399, partial [Eragrostis curvula]